MKVPMLTLGMTGITVPQNAFGALPIQRDSVEVAVQLLRRAYEGGMRFFDTARMYSDSEEKVGIATEGFRDKIYLATKTTATTPEAFWKDLETSLTMLRTDYIDVYQFHQVKQCWRPGDGSGMYECMLEAKAQGKIRHIGVTTHSIGVAEECVASGLYETMQYPFSYLADARELALVQQCKEKNVGFIAMKGLAGGTITRGDVAMAYLLTQDHVLPIWGVQRDYELEEFLSYMDEVPEYNEERQALVARDRKELVGNFCRGCGYCMPCPVGISIRDCARMSLMVRRAPTDEWTAPNWQAEMKKIENCVNCRQCEKKCPYSLPIPELLKKNYEDYQRILSGETKID